MRRIAVVLLAIVCSALAATQCTSDALNVRQSASTSARILRTLPKGTQVNVVSSSNGWAKIGEGQFVSAQYLRACGGAAPQPVVKCTSASLNVRSGASTGSSILRTLPAGTRVSVTSTSNGWSTIGAGQFVSAQFLTNCGAAPAPVPPSGGGSTLSLGQLQAIMPRLSSAKAQQYIGYLDAGMREAGLNNCPRKAAFLAQLAHESGQLNWFEEFASGAAYEGRRDLGNTQPGDGKRYKGRGPIQLTGRSNYRSAGQALGLPLEANPAMVATPAVGFRTSLWFWNSRGLSSIADQNTQSAFDQITRRVNGGYNGKADRDAYWRKAKSVLGC